MFVYPVCLIKIVSYYHFVIEFRGRPVSTYADTMVLDLLHSNDRQQQLAAPNAMVVLNVWMEVVEMVRLSV